MNDMQKRIIELKKEKNALILAHYYQIMDIQEIADHVCDSYEMARRARDAEEDMLVICGVKFMAESAKILSPEKTVLLPRLDAGCPMADMITPQDVTALRDKHPDAAVVCYVNSSAAVKAVSDVCCTSSSAVELVRALLQNKIIFVPDRNLGAFVASKVPEKELILYDGCCPVHDVVTEEDIKSAKVKYPGAPALVHPECRAQVLRHADYIGSTAGIIKTALESEASDYIIGTEDGIADRLRTLAPEKRFHTAKDGFICEDMRKTQLADVLKSLETGDYEILLDDDDIAAAATSLKRMVKR